MRVAFHTLGCKVNQYETSAMEEQFARDGFEVVTPQEEADVYVLNSCTVTAESDKKSRQLLRRFRRQNPASVIALCGCFPQAFPDAAEQLAEADVILGSPNKAQLLPAVKNRLAGGDRVINIHHYEKKEKFESTQISSFGEHTRAFVKIQDGCRRFCSYCIIPHARGPLRSKPLADIKKELTALGEAGYKEVVLVGINLSCYGAELGLHLIDAVREACSVESLERIRLGSLEPELLHPEAIAALAENKKLCPQFHLSLQSGSDGTLRRMKRMYDSDEYYRIAEDLREAFPNCAITTDVMVGFPGETEEEFEESIQFVQKVRIARAHVFAYSRRPGTVADRMENQVPQRTKTERSHRMIEVTNQTRSAFLQEQIGRTEEVLFETQKEDGYWEGYTPNYTPVIVPSLQPLQGKILPVLITTAEEEYCRGQLL